MIDRNSPVSEDELHAYVDGELPADRREAVAAWLAAHPEQAATVAAWSAQAERIRARFGAVADEPVPQRLNIDKVMRNGGTSRRSLLAIVAAAAVVAFFVGGGAGWLARGAGVTSGNGTEFTTDAMQAHRLYVVEVRHPVEVPGDERQHMTQWLTKRLGYQQRVPDLSSIGLKLVGARLLPGPDGAAAAFYMYEGPNGDRYTLYCSKVRANDTALRFREGKTLAAYYWMDDKIGYAVIGSNDRAKLETVTKSIYDQMERSGTRRS